MAELATEIVKEEIMDSTDSITPAPVVEAPKISASQNKNPELLADRNTLLAVVKFLKKHNLKSTEETLKKESNLIDDDKANVDQTDSDVSNVLSTYKSEGNPDIYDDTYTNLKKFIESALDTYKHELAMIVYPVFVHMYLELVYNEHEAQAFRFMEKFSAEQESYHQDDIKRLSTVKKKEHMKGTELIDNFKTSQFTIRMSRDSCAFLKKHLQEKKQNVLLNIIQEHLYLDIYEGITRSKQQVDATAGAMCGEAIRQANKTKVYYGLLKEPELHIPIDDEEDGVEPKKKKAKKDPMLSKKSKNDPNAPSLTRLPLPELFSATPENKEYMVVVFNLKSADDFLNKTEQKRDLRRDADKLDKVNAMRESLKRVKLGSNNLPSISFYTVINAHQTVTSISICEDASFLAAGFSNSFIKVWSLTQDKLKKMRVSQELSQIDKEADDVLVRMVSDKGNADCRCLYGHSGPVYAISFSHNKTSLLSCSEDSTIRLWSLQTWTNLVCYKGHNYPVWDVKFNLQGNYFATCGHDRTARFWSTDHHQPLRLFIGHISDIDCIEFHPNSNYVATGSSDRSIRLWDVLTGNSVRHMTGHKGTVSKLIFSNDGRFLVSGGTDHKILIWDLAYGHLLSELRGHTNTIHALAFSRDGTILASGGTDCSVKLWDVVKLFQDIDLEDLNISHTPNVNVNDEGILLASYSTKSTSVVSLHFTRRNLTIFGIIYAYKVFCPNNKLSGTIDVFLAKNNISRQTLPNLFRYRLIELNFSKACLLDHQLLTKPTSKLSKMKPEEVDFEKVNELLEQSPTASFYLIDVRSPEELKKDGKIKNTTVNIPIVDLEESLKLSPDSFVKKYQVAKPSTDSQLVFTCLSGRRALAGAEIALKSSFSNVKAYLGSFKDWKAKNGAIE
ncbi:Transcription initiation factor TFIID subunit 5 [Nymphon striatum]|nr:Transcription initiation factor TFIID subunit 5 [Nymphon striatum]